MSEWETRRVLVTGASGVVGSCLSRELVARGASVVAFLRELDTDSDLMRSGTAAHVGIVHGSLEDYAAVERAINEHDVDTVFHMGAQAIVGVARRSPLQTFESNVRGTYNLMEACRRLDGLVRRIVVASSDKAYGTAPELPYTEDMPLRASDPYDVSKACTDMIAASYAATYGVPAAITRCGNIYGGGDLNWSRLVPGAIRSYLLGERPVIRGDGLHTRDFLYVSDAVAGMLDLADAIEPKGLAGEAFNLSTDTQRRVIDVVTEIGGLAGRSDLEPVVLDQVVGEIRDQTLSSEKAHRVLGWRPRWSTADGLTETIEWYRSYLARPSAAGLRG